MYLEHYGLNEAPFRITPHTDFFYAGANRGSTLEALTYAVVHDEGIIKVTGEVGSGKTMLCRVLMERLPENVIILYLANPLLSHEDILHTLAEELGVTIPENPRPGSIMRALQETLVTRYGQGKRVVVLIDEAHAMPTETLEGIRLLSNLESHRHKLLKLVLFAQPELNDTLLRTDMRQLRERITHSFTLAPLVREDIAGYLDFRMCAAGYRGPSLFTPRAIRLIDEASQGLTRRINILADKSLLAAYASGTHQVGIKEARAAIRDAGFVGLHAVRARSPLPVGIFWAVGGAAAMLAAVFLWKFTGEYPVTTSVAERKAALAATDIPAQSPTQASAVPAAAPPYPQAGTVAPAPPAKPQPGPMLAIKLARGHAWIESVPDSRWFIQMHTTTDDLNPERVERLLSQMEDVGVEMSAVRAYHSDFTGVGRYGVIYGDFATSAEASRALESLPVAIKRHRPFVRQAVRLKPLRNTVAN